MSHENSRQSLTLAQILNTYGEAFLEKNSLCPEQYKAIKAIRTCRSAQMGGHIHKCKKCNHAKLAYNSCRNRHCNKCQYLKQLVWVDKLKSNLPVCKYFHVVFTIPASLHKLFYLNQRESYHALFTASAQALKKVASNPKYLGAQTGAVSLLHTWGQALTYHPHIHMLVPAGGISEDHSEWIQAKPKYLVPVKVLSKVFRGIIWSLLEKQIMTESIKIPDNNTLAAIKKLVYAKDWNVYAKKALAGPQAVVQYLGKYTHRVAISNSRLVSITRGKITFSWKNYRKGQASANMTLEADEFIGRFVRHILPCGFYKIRYYGWLAAANTKTKVQCTILIGKGMYNAMLAGLNTQQILTIVRGKDPSKCPKCKTGKMMPHTILDPV